MKKQTFFLILFGLNFLFIQEAYSQLYKGNAYYDSTGKVYYYASDGRAYYYPEEVQRQYQRQPHEETSSTNDVKRDYQDTTYVTIQRNNLLNGDWWKTATLEKVKQEIEAGADVEARDKNGSTTLMYAAANNQNSEIIETLLKHGADVEARDNNGWTSLAYAARYNKNPEVIKKLLEANANIDDIKVLAAAENNPSFQVKNFIILEIVKSYEEADYPDRSDFESRVSNCILTEEIKQDFKSSLSVVDQFEMAMASVFSLGLQDQQISKECQCIFNAVGVYLGKTEYKKAIDAFNQGRKGTFKKAVKKAIPAAFAVCF